MDQKSSEWYEARMGKFTSSELYKLMTNGRAKDKEFGDTAISYISVKLHEYFTAGTCLDYGFQGNKATEWGTYYEPEARSFYSEKTGNLVQECGFIQSKLSEMFGGSPDGLVGEDGIIEIKCPYESGHIKNLAYQNADEFKKNEDKYYAQIQGNLMATERQWCDFISYDPRYQNDRFKIKIIRINRDDEFITLATEKIKKAEILFNEMLTKIISQFI